MTDFEISPRDYLHILNRRKWSFIVPAAVIFFMALIIATVWPPIYKSTATILIEEQDIPSDFVRATVTSFAEQQIEATRQRILSYKKLWEIIESFNLYANLRDKKSSDEIVQMMREGIKFTLNTAEILDRSTGRSMTATITFNLSFEANESPRIVSNVANTLVSLFLEENLKVREKQAAETSSFLEVELEKVKKDLTAIETQIAIFKEENINELPEMLQVNMQSLNNLEQNLERLNEQLRSLREREGYLQTQLASIPPDDDTIRDKKVLEELRFQLVSLKTRYSDEYPDVVKTAAEIKELENRLNNSAGTQRGGNDNADNPAYVTLASQLASTKAEINGIKRQLNEYQSKITEYHRRIELTPKVEEAYKAIILERDNLQMKFEDLLRKLMEARVAQGLEKDKKGERFTLIDPPREPEKPYKPNRMAIILVGLILGLGTGVALASFKELADDSIRNPDKLSIIAGFPVLAGIPEILTSKDIKTQKTRRNAVIIGAAIGVVFSITIFHFFIMNLNVFWAVLMRRIGL